MPSQLHFQSIARHHAHDLIAALTQPRAYPFAVDHVDLVQTHISMLFLAGDRVYKVKKPLDMGFVDYSTLEKRRRFCEEEVRLNRRLAPDVYVGVQPVTRDADGVVRIGGQGEVIDFAVEMERLPEHRMLNRLLERGEVDNALLNELAALLVQFHRECATGEGVNEHAMPEELRRQVLENLDRIEACFPRSTLHSCFAVILQFLRAQLMDDLDRRDALLRRRVAQHRVREGHGDLHSGNICVTEHGIVIYDCIEFTRCFRCRDVACELAFLAMDLDYHKYRASARYLVHRYADLTNDYDLESLMRLYKPHLALVRAMVAQWRSVDEHITKPQRAAAHIEFLRYINLAAAYLLKPSLLIMCGLPGTGKSVVAHALANPLDALVFQSDAVRKQLAGIDPADHRSGGERNIYTREFTQRTYAELLNRARSALRNGRTVIIDATMPRASLRAAFIEMARSECVPVVFVYMTAPMNVVKQRLVARSAESKQVSDADWPVYAGSRRNFQPPRELPPAMRVIVRPSVEVDISIARIISALIAAQRRL